MQPWELPSSRSVHSWTGPSGLEHYRLDNLSARSMPAELGCPPHGSYSIKHPHILCSILLLSSQAEFFWLGFPCRHLTQRLYFLDCRRSIAEWVGDHAVNRVGFRRIFVAIARFCLDHFSLLRRTVARGLFQFDHHRPQPSRQMIRARSSKHHNSPRWSQLR
jgi:hypothetical protein